MATTTKGIPYPAGTDNNDAATDMQAIADWLDDMLGSKTTAQIAALTGAALWDGRTVLDSDTGDLKVYRADGGGGWHVQGMVGSIVWMADATDPAGYFYCDGSAYNTTTYAKLFAKIGGEFGSNLPDLRDRMVVGQGIATEFDVIGETGGVKTVTLTTTQLPAHTHTGPSHSHSMDHNHPVKTTSSNGGSHAHAVGTLATTAAGNHDHGIPDPSNIYRKNVFTPELIVDQWDGGALEDIQDFEEMPWTASGTHTHPVTGSVASTNIDHTHTVDLDNFTGSTGSAGTGATGSTGTGSAFSILNPYIVLKPYIKW